MFLFSSNFLFYLTPAEECIWEEEFVNLISSFSGGFRREGLFNSFCLHLKSENWIFTFVIFTPITFCVHLKVKLENLNLYKKSFVYIYVCLYVGTETSPIQFLILTLFFEDAIFTSFLKFLSLKILRRNVKLTRQVSNFVFMEFEFSF